MHYGTAERPSMSPAAARALAQTRHLYLEYLHPNDHARWMGSATEIDLVGAVERKRGVATTERASQAALAVKQSEQASDGVSAVVALDASYHENLALVHNHCGAFYEYGTERLALALAAGSDITLHALESETSRQETLSACKGASRGKPASVWKPRPADARFCNDLLLEVQRDQHEERPYSVTRAQACVLESRHRTMAAAIAGAVKAARRPFVVVGRGHFARGQNLIELIEAQGLTLRRIE